MRRGPVTFDLPGDGCSSEEISVVVGLHTLLRSSHRTAGDHLGLFGDGVPVVPAGSIGGIGWWRFAREGAVECVSEGLGSRVCNEPGVVDDRAGGGLGVIDADDGTYCLL